MILTALNDYYQRLAAKQDDVPVFGYSTEKISYVIQLGLDGGLVDEPIDIRDSRGKKSFPRPLIVPSSFKRPGTGVNPFFLWDKTSYVLGVGDDNSSRIADMHASFRALHEHWLASTEEPCLRALLLFLRRWSPELFTNFSGHVQKGLLGANVVFRLDGQLQYVHESQEAKRLRARMLAEDDAKIGRCLVTGEMAPIERIHPAIKGMPGDKAETSIVSFNLDASKSYGKSQGENASISQQAAFGYTTALNHLLRNDRQRLPIGDTTVVFWATAADDASAHAAESIFELLMDPPNDDAQTERLRNVLVQVRELEARPDLDPGLTPGTRLHILGLASNASRLSIRFWLTDDIRRFAERIADHYEDLDLQPSPWRTPPPLWRLLLATAPSRDGRAERKDVPPQLAGEMTRAILAGTAYPHSLLNTLVMRMRADQKVDQRTVGIRAALCRAVIARSSRLYSHDRSPPVSLDTSNKEPGYVLGRLFSLLENAQYAALGNVNAPIRDRYYGAASATPANVFPFLLRNASNHLSKVRKENRGRAINIEKQISDTIALLDGFPRSLRIESQGNFAIGYYHQTQARFTRNDAPAQDDHDDIGEE